VYDDDDDDDESESESESVSLELLLLPDEDSSIVANTEPELDFFGGSTAGSAPVRKKNGI
jgi:hypothetical protein